VLDFAGVVATHGPITAVQPPTKAGDGNGEAPVKVCDNCDELVPISARECPACGHKFPEPERKKLQLHDDDIMGVEGLDMQVTQWTWRKHISRTSGKEMVACTYYGCLSDPTVTEYFPVLHEGYAGQMAVQRVASIAQQSGAQLTGRQSLDETVIYLNQAQHPSEIEYKRDGKFFRVIKREWNATTD